MATLDIRNKTDDKITSIQFGNFNNGCSGLLSLCKNITNEICLQDKSKLGGNAYIRIEDIDNLILALQKAKELWGNK